LEASQEQDSLKCEEIYDPKWISEKAQKPTSKTFDLYKAN